MRFSLNVKVITDLFLQSKGNKSFPLEREESVSMKLNILEMLKQLMINKKFQKRLV